MKDGQQTTIEDAVWAELIDAYIAELLIREGMPAELPVEHRRQRRKRKFPHGKMHCLECGFHIRGLHHAKGEHHRQGQGTWTDVKGEMHSSKGRCRITRGL